MTVKKRCNELAAKLHCKDPIDGGEAPPAQTKDFGWIAIHTDSSSLSRTPLAQRGWVGGGGLSSHCNNTH